MPLYEYSCRACGKQFTWLAGVIADNSQARCPRCESDDLQKLISRVARGRSDDARMDDLAERLETRDLDDAGSLRQFAREMSREISAESGEDVRDEIEALIESEARDDSDGLNDEFGSDETGFGGVSGSSGDDGTIY